MDELSHSPDVIPFECILTKFVHTRIIRDRSCVFDRCERSRGECYEISTYYSHTADHWYVSIIRPWNRSMGLNRKNSWHCFIFFYFGTEHRTPFGDNVVTSSGPKGFFLNFNIGIVHEILPGWQNFKSPVEIYHGHLKFCRIGRILKVLGYRAVGRILYISKEMRSKQDDF